MDLTITIYLDRADTELLLSEKLITLSEDESIKKIIRIPKSKTFYSSAISHAYYAIFYSAKALLLTKGIKTSSPNIHQATFEEFKKNFVDTGILDVKLLLIYQKLVIRAEDLIEIFHNEKWKRGNFTYNTLPQANKEPAEDSVNNARTFVSNIMKIINTQMQ